jgi:hypothetical protein
MAEREGRSRPRGHFARLADRLLLGTVRLLADSGQFAGRVGVRLRFLCAKGERAWRASGFDRRRGLSREGRRLRFLPGRTAIQASAVRQTRPISRGGA